MRAVPKVFSTTKNLVYATALVYTSLFITNFVMQGMLDRGVEERDELIVVIKKNAYVEDQVRGISNATKLYRDTKTHNLNIFTHLKPLVDVLEDTVVINSITFDREDNYYTVNASTNKATSYATMIRKLLDSERIESMTIEYVDFKAQINEYTADFKVTIK